MSEPISIQDSTFLQEAKKAATATTFLSDEPNRHKLNLNAAAATSYISGLYFGEVHGRGKSIDSIEDAVACCKRAAHWMIRPDCKTSLVMNGNIGTGKSTLLKAMFRLAILQNKKCMYITSDDVAKMKLEHPDSYDYVLSDWYEYIFLDDVGTEPIEVKSYGNATYPFVEIVRSRYDLGLPLIITTNLSYPKDFASIYGERIEDRLKEMSNSMLFKGSSYRK